MTTLRPESIPLAASQDSTSSSNVNFARQTDTKSSASPVTKKSRKQRTQSVAKDDVINHPKHYTSGAIECWDYIVSQGLGFLEGNVIKYVTRYRHKNGREDLLKAKAYLERLLKEIK